MIVLKKLYLGSIRLLILLGVVLVSALQGKAQGLSASDSTRYISLIDSCFTAGNRGNYARAEAFLSEALRLNPPSALQPAGQGRCSPALLLLRPKQRSSRGDDTLQPG